MPGPSGFKTASKAEEREIVRRAQALADDPTLLLPDCIHDDADGCYLRKIESKLEKVHGKKGDKKKLERASGGFFGHDLAKALASTLIVAMEGEAPYLGQVGMAGRKVPYAKRGKADKAALAAVQHFTDPRLRVLPLADTIQKKGLHVYSSGSGWWCTGTSAAPPEEYVDDVVGMLDAVQRRGDGIHTCPHLSPDGLGEEGPTHLVVDWETAGVRVGLCEDCAGDGNAAFTLMAGIASPDPAGEFAVTVHPPTPTCQGHEGTCPAGQAYRQGFDAGGYLSGDLTDRGLVGHAREQVQDRLRRGEAFFLARDTCYGDDVDAFLDALDASDLEAEALRPALAERTRPLVAEQGTANKLLAQLWDDHARAFLVAASDEEIADDVAGRMDPRNTPPVEILREARRRYDEQHLKDRLPTYEDLPQPLAVADKVARTYRLEGKSEAVRACDPDRSWGTSTKAIGYAFLSAFGEAGGETWKFTEEERESGEFLKQYAEQLLEVDPDEYHDALEKIRRGVGVTQPLERAD